MSTRETLLLDYQRADHMFPVGIYQDPYSMKSQFQWGHILLHYNNREGKMKSNYQMVKTNHDKAQLIYTDHNNHL